MGAGRSCVLSVAAGLRPLASGLAAVLLGTAAVAGIALVAAFGSVAAELPAGHDLPTAPLPLTTKIYDRSGEHLLYTLEDERVELVSLAAIPARLQQATVALAYPTSSTNPSTA